MAFGLDDAVAAGLQIINKFVPDPAQKAQAETELRSALQQWDAAQSATNTAEAASADPFTSRWRPFIGWVCGSALAYQYVLAPIGVWFSQMIGHPVPAPPKLDDSLWQLMVGMLGLGGLRTYEKIKGVSK